MDPPESVFFLFVFVGGFVRADRVHQIFEIAFDRFGLDSGRFDGRRIVIGRLVNGRLFGLLAR